ncbi:MAG: tetratricopeptide repeat protein [Pirellulaceae bacterium]
MAAGNYSQSRWEQAATEFRLYLQQYPDGAHTADAVFFLGETLVQLGRYGEAHPYFAELVRDYPEHRYADRAQFRAGESAWLSAQRDSARTHLETFVRQHPRDRLCGFALPYLGELELLAGNAEQAQKHYTEALRLFPQGPMYDDARFGLARSCELLGQTRDAERFYRLLSGAKGAFADDAQLRLGILLHQQKRLPEATQTFAAFEEESGRLADSELRAHALYWLGVVRLAAGETAEAVHAFDLAVADDPASPLAPSILHASASALEQAGQTPAAGERYRRIYSDQPEHELADDSLAAVVRMAADAPTAEMDVESLVQQFQDKYPQSDLLPTVRQSLGRWHLARDEFEAAAELFESLVVQQEQPSSSADDGPRLGAPVPPRSLVLPDVATHAPSSDELQAAASTYYLALAYLGQRRHEEALETLDGLGGDLPAALRDGVRVARASALVGLERYEQALQPLQQYLTSQPTGPDAPRCWAHLAVSLAKLDRVDESAKSLEQLGLRHPQHPLLLPTTEFVAEAAMRNKQVDLARQLYNVLARDANPPKFQEKGASGLAWLDFESNPQASADEFQRLILEHPGTLRAAEAALMRARALEKVGKPQAAVEMYKLIIEKHADSPHLPDAVLGAARVLDEQALDAEALELLQQYLRDYPESKQLDVALYLTAWVLDDLEQPEQADARFRQIVDDHPDSKYWGDAAYRLAERAARDEDFEQADALLSRLVAAKTSDDTAAHALYLRGQVAAAQEHWSDVEPPLAQLIANFPETSLRVPAEYWIAEAAYRQGEFERAGAMFTRLLVRTHDRKEPWLGMIPLRLAQVQAHARQWEKAYKLASGIAQQYPDFRQQYEVDYLLGRCLQSRAAFDFDAARAAYQRVVDSPTGGSTETAAMAQWMIGETYFLQKNYEQAVRAYYRVEQLFAFPRWQSLALLQAGKCLEVQQQYDEAIAAYEQVQAKYADTTAADDAAQRVQVVRQRLSMTAAPKRK